MPPPNAANARKQTISGRIVPAIPFALTKPKSAPKQKPAIELEAREAATEEQKKDLSNGSDQQKERDALILETTPAGSEKSAVISDKQAASEDGIASTQQAGRPESAGSAPMSVSEATTPDIAPSHASAQTPAPVEATSPSTTISPGPSRKPTDRFDMRQIKTELPPEFVPSSGKYTPQSAASSSRDTTSSSRTNNHTQRPSTNGIVFGGIEAPLASPNASAPQVAPIITNTTAARTPQQPYSQSNHFHHSSEPPATRPFYPQHMPMTAQYDGRQVYPYQENGNQFQPSRFVHRAAPSIDSQAPQSNGFDPRSRSQTQASSAVLPAIEDPYSAASIELTSASRPTFAERNVPNGPAGRYPNPTIPPQYPNPEHASRMDNAEAMREHLVPYFAESSYSDCQLEVSDELSSDTTRLALHKIILSRSPVLRDLMALNGESGNSLKLQLHGKYSSVRGVTEALPYLYGAPLVQLDFPRQNGPNGNAALPSNEERMQRALQYIAAGSALKVHSVAVRGLDIAANTLHWDTVSDALAFALDGGLSRFWSGDLGRDEAANGVARPPTYEPYATSFLQRIVHFIVHVFPQNFYLDASAPQLSAFPRLPRLPTPTHASRPSRSDPRLSKIQFGEVRADEHQRPSFAATTISSVLLTLPFSVLKTVLEHFDLAMRLGPDTVGSVMRQVVAEREARRNKVLAAGNIDSSTSPDLSDNLYWEESVQPSQQHRAGFRLSRRRTDPPR